MSEEDLQHDTNAALERDDPIELVRVAQQVALDSSEREWAECTCAQLARHRNANVRSAALMGFGYLAQRFGALDRRRVKRVVERGLFAHHEGVRASAESAAQDLETYLAWEFERP